MKGPAFQFSLPSGTDLLPGVIRQAGYPSSDVVGAEVLAEIERVIRVGREQVQGEGRYRIEPLIGCRPGLLWGDGFRVRSVRWARLAEQLSEPRMVCGFVVTVGTELDREIGLAQESSMFTAFLLDAVGSVLAERLADQMELHIAGVLRQQGLQATGRFSPGYCDWEIRRGQEAIFNRLCPERIGVTCTPSGMMTPRKSISACMLGAGDVPHRYPCLFCGRDCEYRREAGLPEARERSA